MKKTFCIVLFIAFPLFVHGMDNEQSEETIKQSLKNKIMKTLSYGWVPVKVSLLALKFGLASSVILCDRAMSDVVFFMPGGGVSAESKYHQIKEKIERFAFGRTSLNLNASSLTIN